MTCNIILTNRILLARGGNELRKQKQLAIIGLIGLLLILSFPAEVASSTLDWSDDFNDGNYDSWTVTGGTYNITNGQLTAESWGVNMPAFIEHSSNVTLGSWSFDIKIVDSTNVSELLFVSFMKAESGPWTGVDFDLEFYTGTVKLARANDLSSNYYGQWSFPGGFIGYHHFDIIHNITDLADHFYVYINGTLRIDGTAVVPLEDYHLMSFGLNVGSAVDNIEVTEISQVETTTTTTTSTTTTPPPGEPVDMTTILLLAGGAAVVVIVLVAIVKMRS